MVGAILGGVLGAGVAGPHNRAAGAVVGGTAGAVAGHEIGKNSVKCLSYPHRFRYHRSNCRWVQDPDQDGHQFEVCRDSDGVWRPSGRD